MQSLIISNTLTTYSLFAALTLWLCFVAIYDWQTKTIPAWSTWPVIIGVALFDAWQGTWGPLLIFVLFFAWDTSLNDLRSLLRKPLLPNNADRWLLPDQYSWLLAIVVLLYAALSENFTSFFIVFGWLLIHSWWRYAHGGGGDAALLMALLGLFPSVQFVSILAGVALIVTLPRIIWRYRSDWAIAGKALFTLGIGGAVGVLTNAYRRKTYQEPVGYILALAGILTMVLFTWGSIQPF